jgi:small subunit ribosomal protein S9
VTTRTNDRAVGRRKCAIAQVKLIPGTGEIIVNGKPLEKAFPREHYRRVIMKPLAVTETLGKFSVEIKVLGGGTTGQADAICHGIARVLVKNNEESKKVLRQAGLLTRDPRVKERKKAGLKRARKAPQYTKR